MPNQCPDDYCSMYSQMQDLVERQPAVLVNSFDVTSQKEVEEQLEAAKKQLLV